MLKFETYFLIAFLRFYAVKSEDNCSVCVLKDAPNQCGAFCLSALHPLFDHNIKHQHKMNTFTDALSDSQAKLDRIEGLIMSLQTSMETLQISMEETLKKMIQQNCDTGLNEIQEAAVEETVPKNNNTIILPGFERIGSRFFYIEKNVKENWATAENICRRKGGHLASIRNEEELNAITKKLKSTWYWLGINDRENEGEYISVASGKPAQYLKWVWFKNINGNTRDCLLLTKQGVSDYFCNERFYFICQGDHEI
ncbi:hypothetical protein KR084_003141 [Drosophila pseudotakahashii]|nr:hypothetical protein KR084_003141 [Drosophila pseudotakahashii]